MTFNEFNQKVNPLDAECYIARVPGKPDEVCTFNKIKDIAKKEPMLLIYWMPTEGFIAIDTKMLTLAPTIAIRAQDILVYKDAMSLFIIGQSQFGRNTDNNMLGCGVCANTSYGRKKPVLLPFRNKKVNINPAYSKIEMVTDPKAIGELPLWLKPMRRVSNKLPEGIDLPITSNAATIYMNLIGRLKTLDRFQQQEIISFLNEELCTSPCTSDELENILHMVENATSAQFFENNTFLHNKLGEYVVEHCHVIRDVKDKDLYFYNERTQIYCNDQDYLMGYMTRLCPMLKQYQKEEALKYIANYLYDESKPLNQDPFTIVFRNGILNIRDMILRPMTPDNYESIRIDANYDPSARSATVDEFFFTATKGDSAIESLLFEAMGYSMLKTSELQKGFILTGNGRNGKSTYLDLIKAVLGKDNTCAVSFKDLANNFRASQLKGKLASLAGDVSAQPLTDSDLVKSITAGEDVTIEQKYKDAHKETLFATLFFACNKLPRTPDTSEGFYRRWAIIPFNADLSGISRVKGMTFKTELMKQESLDYAAYRAVHAIKRVLETTEEFTEPDAVKKMMQDYKIDNSSVLSFIKDNYGGDTSTLERMSLPVAYSKYCLWADESNRGKMSQATFKNAIKAEANVDFEKK